MWYDGPYTKMLDDEIARLMRRLRMNRKTVVHQETCPCCGAKLVNLYLRENEWKCRRCWEKYDADPHPTMKMGPGKLYMVTKDGTHIPLGAVKKEEDHGEGSG